MDSKDRKAELMAAIEGLGQLAKLASRHDVLATQAKSLVTEIESIETERDKLVELIKKQAGVLDEKDKPVTFDVTTKSSGVEPTTQKRTMDSMAEAKDKAMSEARKQAKEHLGEGDKYLLAVDHEHGKTIFMFGGVHDEILAMLQCLEASQPSSSPLDASDFQRVFDGDVDVKTVMSCGARIELQKL